jgi:N-terminal acetyltransferase B complex non-catalytic subunit
MALNWDKLSKLRRDYAKPKFAFGEVTRQVKKKPNDPYLLVKSSALRLQILVLTALTGMASRH